MAAFPPPFIVKSGSTGRIVAKLQTELNKRRPSGAKPLVVDGKCGPLTLDTAAAFLRLNSLTSLDRQTLARIGVRVLFGIDLSGHNEGGTKAPVDCAKVAASGVQFVYEKATQGERYFADECARRIAEWQRLGVPFGLYHFLEPKTARDDKGRPIDAAVGRTDPIKDGHQEAAHFLRYGDQFRPPLPSAADLESGLNRPGSAADDEYNGTHALAFLDVVKARQTLLPLVYTGDWSEDAFILRAPLHVRHALAEFGLWLPSYDGIQGAEPKKMSRIDVWDSWTIWQSSPKARIPGIAGDVDCNWALAEDLGL